MQIRLFYMASDGYRDTRTYRTLKGAQNYAHKMVGAHPEIGATYAVSTDGVGRLIAEGVDLHVLFPDNRDGWHPYTAAQVIDKLKHWSWVYVPVWGVPYVSATITTTNAREILQSLPANQTVWVTDDGEMLALQFVEPRTNT